MVFPSPLSSGLHQYFMTRNRHRSRLIWLDSIHFDSDSLDMAFNGFFWDSFGILLGCWRLGCLSVRAFPFEFQTCRTMALVWRFKPWNRLWFVERRSSWQRSEISLLFLFYFVLCFVFLCFCVFCFHFLLHRDRTESFNQFSNPPANFRRFCAAVRALLIVLFI